MRKELHDHLCRINPDKNWDFIINQVRRRLLCGTTYQQLSLCLHKATGCWLAVLSAAHRSRELLLVFW